MHKAAQIFRLLDKVSLKLKKLDDIFSSTVTNCSVDGRAKGGRAGGGGGEREREREREREGERGREISGSPVQSHSHVKLNFNPKEI